MNRSTGYSNAATTRSTGVYFVQGLEVGGPYTVRVRRIGFEPVERTDISVTLSQTTRVDIKMGTQARAAHRRRDSRERRGGSGHQPDERRREHADLRHAHQPHSSAQPQLHRSREAHAAGHA